MFRKAEDQEALLDPRPYRTISGVRLCWELEEPKRPKELEVQGYLAH